MVTLSAMIKHVTSIGSPILENRIISLTSGGLLLHKDFRLFSFLFFAIMVAFFDSKMTYGDLASETYTE